MTKKNRLAILTRAREIIGDKKHWTVNKLRRKKRDGTYSYCLLGACEQAAYELGLAEPDQFAFQASAGIGYVLGDEISLGKYARVRFGISPEGVNDLYGYEKTVRLLDEYIEKVKKTPAKELGKETVG